MKQLCKQILPSYGFSMHKGQAGRIAIIGGCEEYTGAPYFAGFSALRLGADLVHIMCTPAAAVPIKTYSPDLMVLPILSEEKCHQFDNWVSRLHSIVIGPGLGRSEEVFSVVSKWIQIAKRNNITIVIDADGIFLITQQPSLIKDYKKCFLTPNIAEYSRLCNAVLSKNTNNEVHDLDLLALSTTLGCSIICKGRADKICHAGKIYSCDEEGSWRRVGGQGDILSGALGLFLHWTNQMEHREIGGFPVEAVACYSACSVVKYSNSLAFAQKGRSMITSDLIPYLNSASNHVFGFPQE